jgi:hypothetical protein
MSTAWDSEMFDQCYNHVEKILKSTKRDEGVDAIAFAMQVNDYATKMYELRKQASLRVMSSSSSSTPSTPQLSHSPTMLTNFDTSPTTPPSNWSSPDSSSSSSSSSSTPNLPRRSTSTVNQINVAGGTNTFNIEYAHTFTHAHTNIFPNFLNVY